MKRDAQLWMAVLMGPTVWMLSLLANFALAPWACAFAWKPALFVVTAVALAVTAGEGIAAWRIWRAVGMELPGELGGPVGHARTLALAGVLLNALFFLVVVAQALPNVILRACD